MPKKDFLSIWINGYIQGNYYSYNYEHIKDCVQCHCANLSKVIRYERLILVFSCLTFGNRLFIG